MINETTTKHGYAKENVYEGLTDTVVRKWPL